MKVTKLLLLVFWLSCLSACMERWQKVERIGVFERTEYWRSNKLNWEGTSTGVYKNKLCLLPTGRCISDQYVHIKETPGRVVEIPAWLNDEQQLATDTGLFDKHTGAPLRCLNCQQMPDIYARLDRLQISWSASGEQGYASAGDASFLGLENNNQKHYELWLLQILADGFEVTELLNDDKLYRHGFLHGLGYSPDEQLLAWHLCSPSCALWWYDIEAETYGHKVLPSQCEYNSYWQIGWQGKVPHSEYYWGATQAHICLGDDGQAAFPVQPR